MGDEKTGAKLWEQKTAYFASKKYVRDVLQDFPNEFPDYQDKWRNDPVRTANIVAMRSLNALRSAGNPDISQRIDNEGQSNKRALGRNPNSMLQLNEAIRSLPIGSTVKQLADYYTTNQLSPSEHLLDLSQDSPFGLFLMAAKDQNVSQTSSWEDDVYQLAESLWGEYHASVYWQVFEYARSQGLIDLSPEVLPPPLPIEQVTPVWPGVQVEPLKPVELWRQRFHEIETKYNISLENPVIFHAWDDRRLDDSLEHGIVRGQVERGNRFSSISSLNVWGGTEAAGREKQGKYKGDEDAIWSRMVAPHIQLGALADGMGGEGLKGIVTTGGQQVEVGGGYLASLYAMEIINRDYYRLIQRGVDPQKAICVVAEIIDCMIDYTPETIVPNKAGLTLTLTYYDEEANKGYVLNIGDNTAKILGKDGKTKKELSHKQENSNGKLLNAISKNPKRRVDVSDIQEFSLESGDRLVIHCDGLDKATDKELSQISSENLGRKLKDQGQRTHDNASVLVMEKK